MTAKLFHTSDEWAKLLKSPFIGQPPHTAVIPTNNVIPAPPNPSGSPYELADEYDCTGREGVQADPIIGFPEDKTTHE